MVKDLNTRDTARSIRDQFDVSDDNSERLMVTEQARIRTAVFEDSANQMGFTEYEYIAEPTACKICAPLNGEIFKLKEDRKSTRLNSSHVAISYAVFCLKKKIYISHII